MKHLKCQTK